MGGWVGGWIIWKYNQLSPKLGWVGAWAELGKNKIAITINKRLLIKRISCQTEQANELKGCDKNILPIVKETDHFLLEPFDET